MSVRAAVWCLWLFALAPPCTAAKWDVTWPECSTTNHQRLFVSRRTSDLEVQSLYLDNCNITTLDPGSFSNVPNVYKINLSHNNISQLDVLLFAALPDLSIIYMAGNALLGKELPSQLFHNNRRLQELDFSFSDMNDTPFDLLQGLGVLVSLSLEHCSLRRVPLFVTQPPLNSLSYLFLDNNRVQRIEDPDTFIRLQNLQNLHLSNNLIEHLHENIFRPLTKLSSVYFGNNRIRNIPGNLFHNHDFLTIDLGNNLIEYLPADAFLNSSFKHINLSGNRLTYLPDTIYPKFFNVSYPRIIIISNIAYMKWAESGSLLFPNPWQCACLNEILVQFKKRGIRYDSTLLDGEHPVCELTDGPCIKNTRIALPGS